MIVKVKFICASPYDFVGENGQRVTGLNLMCYKPDVNKIIKVKVKHTINMPNFADDIEVNANIGAKYVTYEI